MVIQNDLGNYSSPTTIVAAITSKEKKPYPFHVDIAPQESGLTVNSTILLEQLFTINKNRLIQKAGQVSDQKMKEVDKAIKVSMGII